MAAILVIDDDPDMRDMLKATLEGAGHGVSLATDGRKGVEMYRARQAATLLATFAWSREGAADVREV